MVRTNQGGSVLSFVVVGILLLAIFAGGAYLARQYMHPSPEMPTELPGERPQQSSPPEEKSSEQPVSDSQKDDSQKEEAERPQEESKPRSDASGETPASKDNGDGHTTLPETGPAQMLASLLAAGLLSVAAVSYLRSRRPELSL